MKDLHGARRRVRAVCTLACAASLLGACSPTYNWRELRLEGTPLQALMPCKPEVAQRRVPMAGLETDLHMQSCETGGVTYALAWADVGQADRVEAALAGWVDASLRSIRADITSAKEQPQGETSVAVKGASLTRGVSAQGLDHKGQALSTWAVYFAQGTQVYQAAVYGARLPEAAVAPFFDGLRLP